MHILVTGGAGFLGRLLIETLLATDDTLRITAIDTVEATFDNPRVSVLAGDLADEAWLSGKLAALPPVERAFHLAAVVSGGAEADFDLGYRVNLDGTRHLLEALRRQRAGGGPLAQLLFTSTVAVFGGALPEVVTDETTPVPQTSYGVQKLMCEHLIGDYARKGFVDGRSVRLPTISVRPGKPNLALSSFASGIIREPLAGLVSELPVPRDTPVWLLSPDAAVAAFRHTLEIPFEKFHDGIYGRAVNLPGLTLTVEEMLDALQQVGGDTALTLVRDAPDERVMRVVKNWPARFLTARAAWLGYQADPNFLSVVRAYKRKYT